MNTAVNRTTTLKLKVGDKIQNGNCVRGFTYSEIVGVEKLPNKNMVLISEKFAHGGIASYLVGKNANWYVVAEKVGA